MCPVVVGAEAADTCGDVVGVGAPDTGGVVGGEGCQGVAVGGETYRVWPVRVAGRWWERVSHSLTLWSKLAVARCGHLVQRLCFPPAWCAR